MYKSFGEFWKDIRPSLTWQFILYLLGYAGIGGIFVTAVVALVRNWLKQPYTYQDALLTLLGTIAGIALLLFIATIRQRVQKDRLGVRMTILLLLPIVIAVLFVIWSYLIADQVRKFNVQAARYVLPRELSPTQIDSIANHLGKYEEYKGQRVILKMRAHDPEATMFGESIYRALEKGGWNPIREYKEERNGEYLDPGLRIVLPYKQPQSDVLKTAWRQSGTPLQADGGWNWDSNATPQMVLEIGKRRRDRFAVEPAQRQPGPKEEYPIEDHY